MKKEVKHVRPEFLEKASRLKKEKKKGRIKKKAET